MNSKRRAKTGFLKKKIAPYDPLAARTVNEAITALGPCSFQGRQMAYALDVWERMARDRRCFRVLSLAGAMVPAGMGLVVIRLIEAGLLHAIVCTGATLSHDICNTVAQGDQAHYLGDPHEDDLVLREEEINRIYDTYLSEAAFQSAEKAVVKLLPRLAYGRSAGGLKTITTTSFCRQLGERLPGYSLITTAARAGVSIYVPAISDSELGLNIIVGNETEAAGRGQRVLFDTLGDVQAFAEQLIKYPRSGLVSLGGGVPRNWAQQIYPYLNMKSRTLATEAEGYHYGVRITTDRPEHGGLSGCTISESKSWGKYERRAEESSVVCDATIAFPLMATALLERLARRG